MTTERDLVSRFLLPSTLYDTISFSTFVRNLPPVYRDTQTAKTLHAEYVRYRAELHRQVKRNIELEYRMRGIDGDKMWVDEGLELGLEGTGMERTIETMVEDVGVISLLRKCKDEQEALDVLNAYQERLEVAEQNLDSEGQNILKRIKAFDAKLADTEQRMKRSIQE